MVAVLLALVSFAATTHPATTRPATTRPAMDATLPLQMESFRWKHRPLLVFAPDVDDLRLTKQREWLDATQNGLAERDMVVITLVGADAGTFFDPATGEGSRLSDVTVRRLRLDYEVLLGDFAVILVGKDGGEKRRDTSPTELDAIFEQIDAMPMRQSEMRERDERSDD
jgi:hypothetical protein